MPLTDEQLRILGHDPRVHARIIAGPGTGKSFTSLEYLGKLLRDQPELKVQYLTFTRIAIAEFANQLPRDIREAMESHMPSTVHGFALSQLMRHRHGASRSRIRMPDTWENKHIIQPDISRALRARGYDDATPTMVADLEKEMAAGFESLDPDLVLNSQRDPALRQAYIGTWQQHRRTHSYMLQSQLTYDAGNMLHDLEGVDVGVDLLLVDEYQDLNNADMQLIREAARHGSTVIAIGDDDQSIYGWRMAAPAGIQNFLTEYDTDADYNLTQSRRCGGELLGKAASLIQLDPNRQAKPPVVASPEAPTTEFAYITFQNDRAEMMNVAKLVKARIDVGVDPHDVVILVRSNVATWHGELAQWFESYSITLAGGKDPMDLLAEDGMRRMLAMARLLSDPLDSLSWRGLLNITDSIGPVFVNYVTETSPNGTFAERLIALHDTGTPPAGVTGARAAFEMVTDVKSKLLEVDVDSYTATDGVNWGEWLLDTFGRDNVSEAAIALLTKLDEVTAQKYSLGKYINEIETLAKEAFTSQDGVRILTLSQSKGITVDTAILMGVEQGLIPSARGQYDEEVRMLYVGITRAKLLTVMTRCVRRRERTSRLGSGIPGVNRESCELLSGILASEDGEAFVQARASA